MVLVTLTSLKVLDLSDKHTCIQHASHTHVFVLNLFDSIAANATLTLICSFSTICFSSLQVPTLQIPSGPFCPPFCRCPRRNKLNVR
jgi:hypothetical protein